MLFQFLARTNIGMLFNLMFTILVIISYARASLLGLLFPFILVGMTIVMKHEPVKRRIIQLLAMGLLIWLVYRLKINYGVNIL